MYVSNNNVSRAYNFPVVLW